MIFFLVKFEEKEKLFGEHPTNTTKEGICDTCFCRASFTKIMKKVEYNVHLW